MPTCDGPEEKHFTVGGYAGRLGMFVNTAMIVVSIPEGSVCHGTGIPLGVAVTGINFQRVRSQNDLKEALQRVPSEHDRIVVSCQLAGQSWDNEEQREWWRGVVGTAESEEQAAARRAAEAAAGGGGGGADDEEEDSDGGYDPHAQVIDYAKAKKAAEAAAASGGSWRGGGGGADEDADEYQPEADPNYISFESGGGGGGSSDAAKQRPKGYAGYSGFDNERVGGGGYEEEDESYVRRRPQPHVVPAGVPVAAAVVPVVPAATVSSGLHPCPVSGPSCGRSAEQCWAGTLPESTCMAFLVAGRCPSGDACALLHAKPTSIAQQRQHQQGAVPLPHRCEECALSMQRAGDLSSHLLYVFDVFFSSLSLTWTV